MGSEAKAKGLVTQEDGYLFYYNGGKEGRMVHMQLPVVCNVLGYFGCK